MPKGFFQHVFHDNRFAEEGKFALKSLYEVLKQDFSLIETMPLQRTNDFLGSVDLEDAASIESAAASFRKEHGHLIQNSNPVHSQAPGTVSGMAKPIDEMSEKEIWASFNKE